MEIYLLTIKDTQDILLSQKKNEIIKQYGMISFKK